MSKLRITIDVLLDVPKGFELVNHPEGHHIYKMKEFPDKEFDISGMLTVMEKDPVDPKYPGESYTENRDASEFLNELTEQELVTLQIVEDDFEIPN